MTTKNAPLQVRADGRMSDVGYESSTPVYNFCRSTARFACNLAFDLHVTGATNVPLSGGMLLVANHASFLDPIVVAAKLPRAISFLARSTLFDPLGFGWLIRNCNAFPVKQGKGDVGAMKQSIALLQGGKALLVFPEGNRSPDGDLQEIAAGAALIVKRAKVPVVPVAIRGAFEAWPRHRPLPRTGRIRVKFGHPTAIHDRDGREIVSWIGGELQRMLGELDRDDPVRVGFGPLSRRVRSNGR